MSLHLCLYSPICGFWWPLLLQWSLQLRDKMETLSVGNFVDHDMVFFLQREKSTWIGNNSALLDFFLFSISGTGLKVILLTGSLKVISPFLFVAHKILPFFFFNLNICQADNFEKVWMGIVMIIEFLYETAVILLLLMESVGQESRDSPAEMAWLCSTRSGASVSGDSSGWEMDLLWVSALVCLVPAHDLNLGSVGSVN